MRKTTPSDTPVLGRTIWEACQMLGFGRTHVYRLIAEKKLKARAVGGRTRIDDASIREFYESCPELGSDK